MVPAHVVAPPPVVADPAPESTGISTGDLEQQDLPVTLAHTDKTSKKTPPFPTHIISPKLITMANVVGGSNGKDAYHLGMVVQ